MAWAQRDDSIDREFSAPYGQISRIRQLQSCDRCMEPIAGDAVRFREWVYCSIDCALEDLGDHSPERVPGLYLG
jgi:hypothetical protein